MMGLKDEFFRRRPLLRRLLGVRVKVVRLDPTRPYPKEIVRLRGAE